MSIDLRRGGDRFVTQAEGRTTYHSFSYGEHYDPTNVAFGPLVAINDEQLPAGTGYDDHRHAATVIVTWVVQGQLAHRDSLTGGANGWTVHEPGTLAVSATGSGIVHAERATQAQPVRFLQMMLRPEQVDIEPTRAVTRVPRAPGLHPVAGPARHGGLSLGVPGARLWAGELPLGDLLLPAAPLVHLFVVTGRLTLGEDVLGPADAARLVEEEERRVVVEEPATLAVWTFR